MKLKHYLQFGLAVLATVALSFTASATLVTVSSTEVWNGTNNPHAADGVTVGGTGTVADPYIYGIPDGMTITSTGLIRLSGSLTDTNDSASITFQIAGGNLQIDSGGYIDCGSGWRNLKSKFNIDMGGGSITGDGKIIGIDGVRTPGIARTPNARSLTIFNVLNVSLVDIDLHTENINCNPLLSSIKADGSVSISGTVTTSDTQVSGGGTGGAFTIGAASVTVSNIDTRALRNDGATSSGALTLQALYPLFGTYDPNYSANAYGNQLVVKGSLTTAGLGGGGNITMQGVVIRLNPGSSLAKSSSGTLTVAAGLSSLVLPTNDLFMNISGTLVAPANTALNPAFTVNWDGTLPGGNAPAFTNNLIVAASVLMSNAYSGTLVGSATDADSDPLTYLKGGGPDWLQIATNGTLSGTPLLANNGTNLFSIAVTDGTRYGLATLKIVVTANPTAPAFLTSPVVKAPANYGLDYSSKAQTLAGSASDLNFDSMTFAKVSGPSWLSVASGGALSGTPTVGDLGTNTWSVSVSDGSLSATGALQIVVVYPPSLVTVSGVEVWNGSNNLHAADGVTLTGSGTPTVPYVYTIPSGMRITGNGSIRLSASVDYGLQNDTNHITFKFTGGNLQMDSGGWIDVGHNSRNVISRFLCDLGGGNIVGAGKILGIDHGRNAGAGVNLRFVTITNATAVSLANIDMHTENLNTTGPDLRINATNAVSVGGTIDTRCTTANNHPGSCFISAGSITVSNVDSRAMAGAGLNNGSITLKALNAAGAYSTSYAGNAYTNQIVVNGAITSAGLASPLAGNITLQSVVLRMETGSTLAKATNGVLTFAVGTTNLNVPTNLLFMNIAGATVGPSGTPLIPTYNITWNATLVPPFFLSMPVVKANGKAGVDYSLRSETLAADALDPQWGSKTFAKVSGPSWLTVAANGSLSGTPTSGDVGTNSWSVSVTASSVSATNTLQIVVVAANTPVAITSSEDWDGVQNPHAGDGVTLAPGTGVETNPAVYTIPSGLTMSATAVMRMSPTTNDDRSITLQFTNGNLQIDNGGVINVARRTRLGRQVLKFDLGGWSITGAGKITGLINSDNTPRAIVMVNAKDIYMNAIDVHVENVQSGDRAMSITATNHIEIGTIDNSDRDTGGGSGAGVTVSANTLTVSNIFTYARRTAGGANGGQILLKALAAPGFSTTNGAANNYSNALIALGTIQVHTNVDLGNAVTLQAVHLQLGAGFNLIMSTNGYATNLQAGVYPNGLGATAADMFTNSSPVTGLNPVYDVQWTGGFASVLPPILNIGGFSGGATNLTISWGDSSYGLQSNTNLTDAGGWVDVPGTSPFQVPIGDGTKFFRLKK